MPALTAGLGKGEAEGLPAGKECPAGQPSPLARGPITVRVVADIDVVGARDRSRDKVAHLTQRGYFTAFTYKAKAR